MKGKHNRGVAQLVSASGLGPEGPVFESQYPDKKEMTLVISFFLLIRVVAHKDLILNVLLYCPCR